MLKANLMNKIFKGIVFSRSIGRYAGKKFLPFFTHHGGIWEYL
jgi:hypothetical protein